MAIKSLKYMADINGIIPTAKQFAGMQGDHRVAEIVFTISDILYSKIKDNTEWHKILYRFDIHDGSGGIWSSEAKELDDKVLSMELEERHTRFGGKITIYLVITALSTENETEMELYCFPAVLKLTSRLEGFEQNGKNYDSITGLAEIAKQKSVLATESAAVAQQFAEKADESVKLSQKNAEQAEFAANEAVNALRSIDTTIKDATDQVYNAESENAQSGKAVAEALQGYVEKVEGNFATDQVYAVDYYGKNTTIEIEDTATFQSGSFDFHNCIPRRNDDGNLMTNTPVKGIECANKAYVDDAVSKLSGLNVVVVSELPANGELDSLYFVPVTTNQEQNLFDEYIFINDAWEKIGSTSVDVDLTDYVKEVNEALALKANLELKTIEVPSGMFADAGYPDGTSVAAFEGVGVTHFDTPNITLIVLYFDNGPNLMLDSPKNPEVFGMTEELAEEYLKSRGIVIGKKYRINKNGNDIISFEVYTDLSDKADKTYVDRLIGDIESLLGGI